MSPRDFSTGDTELWSAIKRIEKKIDRLLSLPQNECRQGTGETTSLGERLCRLPIGHEGEHSPKRPEF